MINRESEKGMGKDILGKETLKSPAPQIIIRYLEEKEENAW